MVLILIETFKIVREESEKQVFRFLFVGQISYLKGTPFLLKAFEQLNLQCKNAELWLCGHVVDGSEKLAFTLPENVKYFGHVPFEELPEIYDQVDVLVSPTLFDGFSQVCLEAMACGKPVITTSSCGIKDLIENGKEGFIVPSKDVNALVEKMTTLINNHKLCNTMGKKAKEKAKNYTWEKYYSNVADIFSTKIF